MKKEKWVWYARDNTNVDIVKIYDKEPVAEGDIWIDNFDYLGHVSSFSFVRLMPVEMWPKMGQALGFKVTDMGMEKVWIINHVK